MHLPEAIRDQIVSHAIGASPEEACGLLAVDLDGCVRRAYCLTNVERSPVSFTVDPDEHFASLTDAEASGWTLGGSFHSHPRTAPIPSRTDVARALEPDWIYLIVGLAEPDSPDLRAWRIRNGTVEQEPIDIATAADHAGAPCR